MRVTKDVRFVQALTEIGVNRTYILMIKRHLFRPLTRAT